MNLFDQVSDDIKAAMLAKDRIRLQALRGIKKEFLEAKTAKGGNGELTDEAAVKILQKMVKQRKESAEIFKAQGREELAGNELAEVAAIEVYLPKQLSAEELETALKEIITRTGAEGPKDMGKVMGAATKALAGKADGRMISETVKKLLG
ncbi:MAG: GatB/YqeY domain-containing protein [Tannerellaceae bacterium]|jgi:uncharacterized protein YqeY|nr:GatB/YqeY domain-containing protein [Tannerellaceae bacterium]